ncbi:MAG: hypothetical protein BGO67_10325 [Alphaproteobacteria bacterium 41-28]|nr:MAG: hypothetical protein BGO67_10325 [Alphaproteobacteria bacterium 41-28]
MRQIKSKLHDLKGETMQKMNLLLIILMTSSFLAFDVYAMESDEKDRDKARYVATVYLNSESDSEEEENEEEKNLYTVDLTGPITLLGGGYAKGKFKLISEDGKNEISYASASLKAEVVGFESQDLPGISTLNPLAPLPKSIKFGSSYKKIRYVFQYEDQNYEDEVVDTFSTPYQHRAEWIAHKLTLEDQAHHESRFTLQLKVRLEDGALYTASELAKTLKHRGGNIGPQLPGKLYYNGKTVSLRRYRQKEWIVPRAQGQALQSYSWPLKDVEEAVPTHQNSKIAFVEVIPILGERVPALDKEYRGDYDNPPATLPLPYRKGKLASKYLIFSDGKDIFSPKITHELWERNGWRVGFGIASYNYKSKVEFLSVADVPNNRKLEEGLYRLFSINEKKGKRIEKWRRLGDKLLDIEIKVPLGVSSIPGLMTYYVESWK